MLNKESLEQAMGILGELTQEQKALIMEAAEKDMPDKDLFEKLGSSITEKKFEEFLQAASDEKEREVFEQAISVEELEAVTGADKGNYYNCVKENLRTITGRYWEGGILYNTGFPNCAATVEDGSLCNDNDACYSCAVVYQDMKECSKAWR